MMPPICTICHQRASEKDFDDFALLSFAHTENSMAWHKKSKATPGFVGHPPNVAWFCPTHAQQVREHTALTLSEAIKKITALS